MNKIKIKQTGLEDLQNTMQLWNDGDVMKFVGFPNGLGTTIDKMERWLSHIEKSRPNTNHFSVFYDGQYVGETFFSIDEHKNAAMDIKLFAFARGRGIASFALSYAIEQAFENGAEKVYVDPNKQNAKAIALYEKLGFKKAEYPQYLQTEDFADIAIYMELRK